MGFMATKELHFILTEISPGLNKRLKALIFKRNIALWEKEIDSSCRRNWDPRWKDEDSIFVFSLCMITIELTARHLKLPRITVLFFIGLLPVAGVSWPHHVSRCIGPQTNLIGLWWSCCYVPANTLNLMKTGWARKWIKLTHVVSDNGPRNNQQRKFNPHWEATLYQSIWIVRKRIRHVVPSIPSAVSGLQPAVLKHVTLRSLTLYKNIYTALRNKASAALKEMRQRRNGWGLEIINTSRVSMFHTVNKRMYFFH
jgi:hypothetical protein